MSVQSRFILGAIAGVVALAGLFAAAGTADPQMQMAGLAVAALGLIVCGFLIKNHYDRLDRDPDRPRHPRFAEPYVESPPPPAAPYPVAAAAVGQSLPPSGPASGQSSAGAFDPATRAWIRGGVIGVLGLLGLVVAAGGTGFAYWGGLLAFAAAVLILFRMIGRAFERGEERRSSLPLPPAGEKRWAFGGLLGLVAVVALFVASGGGDAYYLGLMAAVAALAYLFWIIKSSFDETERH